LRYTSADLFGPGGTRRRGVALTGGGVRGEAETGEAPEADPEGPAPDAEVASQAGSEDVAPGADGATEVG
jgi:hypothetical protein